MQTKGRPKDQFGSHWYGLVMTSCNIKIIEKLFVLTFYFLDEVNVNMEDGAQTAKILASSVWGILRGLETFSQMVYTTDRFGNGRQVSNKSFA